MFDNFSKKVTQLKQYIDEADNIVFFGGAGVSTESGIPDFRSKNGMYNDEKYKDYDPEYLMSIYCLLEKPEIFYTFIKQKLDVRKYEPNITHIKLAELEKDHNLTIVTQNIDGLHQKAGSKNVLEIHGTSNIFYCRRCGKTYTPDEFFDGPDLVPICNCKEYDNPYCPPEQAYIRPKVSLFGEFLPPAIGVAKDKVRKADLLIVGGTSLKVFPAAALVPEFKNKATIELFGIKKPKRLVIINQQATDFDKEADLVINESLGKVFSQL